MFKKKQLHIEISLKVGLITQHKLKIFMSKKYAFSRSEILDLDTPSYFKRCQKILFHNFIRRKTNFSPVVFPSKAAFAKQPKSLKLKSRDI